MIRTGLLLASFLLSPTVQQGYIIIRIPPSPTRPSRPFFGAPSPASADAREGRQRDLFEPNLRRTDRDKGMTLGGGQLSPLAEIPAGDSSYLTVLDIEGCLVQPPEHQVTGKNPQPSFVRGHLAATNFTATLATYARWRNIVIVRCADEKLSPNASAIAASDYCLSKTGANCSSSADGRNRLETFLYHQTLVTLVLNSTCRPEIHLSKQTICKAHTEASTLGSSTAAMIDEPSYGPVVRSRTVCVSQLKNRIRQAEAVLNSPEIYQGAVKVSWRTTKNETFFVTFNETSLARHNLDSHQLSMVHHEPLVTVVDEHLRPISRTFSKGVYILLFLSGLIVVAVLVLGDNQRLDWAVSVCLSGACRCGQRSTRPMKSVVLLMVVLSYSLLVVTVRGVFWSFIKDDLKQRQFVRKDRQRVTSQLCSELSGAPERFFRSNAIPTGILSVILMEPMAIVAANSDLVPREIDTTLAFFVNLREHGIVEKAVRLHYDYNWKVKLRERDSVRLIDVTEGFLFLHVAQILASIVLISEILLKVLSSHRLRLLDASTDSALLESAVSDCVSSPWHATGLSASLDNSDPVEPRKAGFVDREQIILAQNSRKWSLASAVPEHPSSEGLTYRDNLNLLEQVRSEMFGTKATSKQKNEDYKNLRGKLQNIQVDR